MSTIQGTPWNVEIKMTDAQYSSWTINDVNINTNEVTIKKSNGLPDAVIEKIKSLDFKSFQAAAAKYGVTIIKLEILYQLKYMIN